MKETSAAAAEAAQDAIIDEFSFFGDWTERYQYLIDLGRKLAPFPEADKTEANKVHGCQSQVWLVVSGDAERLTFAATSDSTPSPRCSPLESCTGSACRGWSMAWQRPCGGRH